MSVMVNFHVGMVQRRTWKLGWYHAFISNALSSSSSSVFIIQMVSRCEIFCEILIAILLPPLGVCLRHGCCTVEFCICLLLTLLGYIPGIIYALYAIVFIDRDQYFDEYRRPLYAPSA